MPNLAKTPQLFGADLRLDFEPPDTAPPAACWAEALKVALSPNLLKSKFLENQNLTNDQKKELHA